jgi:hypothetical protein
MEHTAELKFGPAGRSRLPELLDAFGCADVVAPVDADAFAKKAGELISPRKAGELIPRKKAETAAGKYRLRALQCEEVAAQTRDPCAKDMLSVLARELKQGHGGPGRVGRRVAGQASSTRAPLWRHEELTQEDGSDAHNGAGAPSFLIGRRPSERPLRSM